MKRVRAVELRAGMRLARPIFGARGRMILARGTALNDFYIRRIRDMDIPVLYISDPSTWTIVTDDLVSDEVRSACVTGLSTLMDQITQTITPSVSSTIAAGGTLPQTSDRALDKCERVIAALRRDVHNILRDTLTADVVTGISALHAHAYSSYNHAVDVSAIALIIARALSIPDQRIIELAMGALLHDVGKVVMDSDLQDLSYDEMSDEQRARYQTHTSVGFEILQQLNPDHLLANQVAWQHHEHFDGSGWPRGLRGDPELRSLAVRKSLGQSIRAELLDISEIVSVANVYTHLAVGSSRTPPLSTDRIIGRLLKMSGTILNPKVVRTLVDMMQTFPIGTPVMIRNGAYHGYLGIVSRFDPQFAHRPTVRLIATPENRACQPTLLSLREHPDVAIRAHVLPALKTLATTQSLV